MDYHLFSLVVSPQRLFAASSVSILALAWFDRLCDLYASGRQSACWLEPVDPLRAPGGSCRSSGDGGACPVMVPGKTISSQDVLGSHHQLRSWHILAGGMTKNSKDTLHFISLTQWTRRIMSQLSKTPLFCSHNGGSIILSSPCFFISTVIFGLFQQAGPVLQGIHQDSFASTFPFPPLVLTAWPIMIYTIR